MNQLSTEVRDWKVKFENTVSELHVSTEQTKKLQRDLQAQQEQLDTATTARARFEREKKKAVTELEDLTVLLANEKQTNSSLQSKQKVHDKQTAELRSQQEQMTSELERTQAELRDSQSKVLVLKNDLADMEQRATGAEGAKKKLEKELEELIQVRSRRYSPVALARCTCAFAVPLFVFVVCS